MKDSIMSDIASEKNGSLGISSLQVPGSIGLCCTFFVLGVEVMFPLLSVLIQLSCHC